MKQLLFLAAAALMLAACGGGQNNADSSEKSNPPTNRIPVGGSYVIYTNGDVLPVLDLDRKDEVCGVGTTADNSKSIYAIGLKNYVCEWHKADEIAKDTKIGGRQASIPSVYELNNMWYIKHAIDTLRKYGVDADPVLNDWYWTDGLQEGGRGFSSREYVPERAVTYNYEAPAYSGREKGISPTSENHPARLFAYIGRYYAFKGKRSEEKNPVIPAVTDDFTGMELVFVEGGTFMMGYTEEQNYNVDKATFNAHTVILNDFYIGKYEVTQKQWEAVMGNNPSEFKTKANLPVEKVNWNDVQKFIRKLNEKTGKDYRLPTEAEWEYAARGGAYVDSPHRYSGGSYAKDVAWCGSITTASVGSRKKTNELGLYDMSGNVYEWCSDWYDYYRSEPQTNPQGPARGYGRVVRGGCWANDANDRGMYVSSRGYMQPDESDNQTGFRLVCSSK
jgi:formylglycine-generating enzyme required for sulfatase activity